VFRIYETSWSCLDEHDESTARRELSSLRWLGSTGDHNIAVRPAHAAFQVLGPLVMVLAK
jgi:hypothetical protein